MVCRRDTADHRDRVTSLLSYEAHVPMAERELQKLAIEAVERFGLLSLVIVHRLGEVPIGEASVVVGCSSCTSKGDLRRAALGDGYLEADRSRFGSEKATLTGRPNGFIQAPHQIKPIPRR